MHTVNVPGANTSLAGMMSEMRSWLDSHEISPSLFRIEQGCYRLEFARKSDAVSFAAAFGGCLVKDRTEVWIDVPVTAISRRARSAVARRAA